ncbi:MAG TPA: sigma-70 family RNA polymerase sigma factor [Acidimicrobiales bacterium]|nr:sigma-70 family RNA polymerase sigma factor [Acidimicrobiales bacterium]
MRARSADGESDVVTGNIGLVRMVVRRMRGRATVGFDVDDMTQEGLLGLLRAARRWDAGRGLRFSSLAVPCIRGAIATAWTRRAERIRVPDGARDRARRAGQPVGWERRFVSLDSPLGPGRGAGGPDGGGLVVADVLADDRATDPATAAELADRACRLLEALAALDPLARAVLVHRYGLAGEALTWTEVAARLGLTPARARQVEAAALAALREVPSLAA